VATSRRPRTSSTWAVHGDRARAILSGASPTLALGIAARALALVEPPSITAREDRLLALAEEFRALAATHAAFTNHMQIYLALALCEWASRGILPERGSEAALLAAVALSVEPSANLREVMGVSERLRQLVGSPANRALAAAVRRLLLGGSEVRLEVCRALFEVLRDLEAPSDGAALVETF
jgi:hypothetical protein